MASLPYVAPIKVTIPVPSEIPKGFGINSTGKRGGNLRVRCTNPEYDMIQHEAELSQLSLANFCRWCIVHVAQAMKEHRDEHSTNDGAGDDS